MDYQYELEGFDLGGGIWYLPDFFLPQVQMWVEVKPVDLTDEEMKKCGHLVAQSGQGCLLLVGIPEDKPYLGIVWDGQICYIRQFRLTHDKGFDEGRLFSGPWQPNYFEDTMFAVELARQARFERASTYEAIIKDYRETPELFEVKTT
jgi:hypothetical protein